MVVDLSKYILRLDDASEYMDIKKWTQMELLLDQYNIKPIFGIIPDNRDSSIIEKYEKDLDFWEKMKIWESKGWIPAMHGCEHKYVTNQGGINPVNKRSEFAGLPYSVQAEKIERGWKILGEHQFTPEIFFAPSHTFDENTLRALKEKTSIRIVSDTIAGDIYKENDFWFIPQQSGSVRKLPFKVVTFCYHPNTMKMDNFKNLEKFLQVNRERFVSYAELELKNRRLSLYDKMLRKIYFFKR